MKIYVRFEGGEQLAKNLNALSTRMSNKIQREALMEGAEPIRKSASAFAPREPGAPDLADNIGIAPIFGRKEVTVAIGPTRNFFYGFFQEFGTTRHGIQAFMRPAFDAESRRSLGVITGAMWHALISRGFTTTRGGGGSSVPDSGGDDSGISGGPMGSTL